MFNILGGSKDQPNSLSIREANEQIQAMHLNKVDLEQRIKELKELLDRRDREYQIRLSHIADQKDEQIAEEKGENVRLEKENEDLKQMLRERDFQIGLLLNRCSYLDQAASYAPLLDQLSQCLKNAFISPSNQPNKIQSVKPTRPSLDMNGAHSSPKETSLALKK